MPLPLTAHSHWVTLPIGRNVWLVCGLSSASASPAPEPISALASWNMPYFACAARLVRSASDGTPSGSTSRSKLQVQLEEMTDRSRHDGQVHAE